jgi:hypothetical protein
VEAAITSKNILHQLSNVKCCKNTSFGAENTFNRTYQCCFSFICFLFEIIVKNFTHIDPSSTLFILVAVLLTGNVPNFGIFLNFFNEEFYI